MFVGVTWLSFVLLVPCTHASSPDPRVVNGEEVDPPFSFPWMAAVILDKYQNSYRGGHCGGTVIGPRHVLTAAHCAIPKKHLPGGEKCRGNCQLAVEAWRHDLSTPADSEGPLDATRHAIAARNKVVDIHRYHATKDMHDVAVLIVEREYPPEVYSGIILNQQKSRERQAGAVITAIGWGSTDQKGNVYPKKLQTVDLEVVDHAACNRKHQRYGGVQSWEWCAYGHPNKDTCSGDSGGPSYVIENGKYVIMGIDSWGGDRCAVEKWPGVKASVASHYEFIQGILGVDAPSPSPGPLPAPPTSSCTGKNKPNNNAWKRKCQAKCNGTNCWRKCGTKCSAGCACNQDSDNSETCENKNRIWTAAQCRTKCNGATNCHQKCSKRCTAACSCVDSRRLAASLIV